MSLILRQSTAKAVSFGPFLDKTDGVSLEVGLVSALDHASTGIFLSKNGGALTIRHATVTASTYDAYGNYIVTLDTTDTNTVGTLRMQFSEAATCLPVWQDFIVVEEAVFDALFAASAPGYGTAQTGDTFALANGANGFVATKADTAAILIDTAEIGAAGAGLTAINLPDQTMNITGNITGNLTGSVGSVTGAVGSVTGAVGSVTGLTNATISDAVWDEAIAGHLGAGSTGAALSAAGAAGDPWITPLPGLYVSGTAGYIVGNNLDAPVSDTASQTSVDDLPTNAELATALGTADDAVLAQVALVKAKTDNLPSDPADASVIAGRFDTLDTSIADLPTNAELATALGTADDAVLTAIGDLPTNAELAAALGTADDAVLAAIAALNNLSAAQVNAEVVDALATDTYAEPTGVPAATASIAGKIGRLHQALRNAITVTATAKTFKNDAGADLWAKALSDDGVTYTEAEGA